MTALLTVLCFYLFNNGYSNYGNVILIILILGFAVRVVNSKKEKRFRKLVLEKIGYTLKDLDHD